MSRPNPPFPQNNH
ncbi:hypothetical protein D031_0768A, partial [Vibrio parahaemolyticus VP-48]